MIVEIVSSPYETSLFQNQSCRVEQTLKNTVLGIYLSIASPGAYWLRNCKLGIHGPVFVESWLHTRVFWRADQS